LRDWTQTLFPASYMGVPFWVKSDKAPGGRRLAVTEKPGVDTPDIEDLGNKARFFHVDGYTLGDASDVQMAALTAVCNSAGPGVLVLPAQGPQLVHCEDFEPSRDRDKMGRFGFTAKFILAGVSPSVTPPEYLAQLAFDAVGALSGAASGFLSGLSL
jgi:prophage DNA circulation protein